MAVTTSQQNGHQKTLLWASEGAPATRALVEATAQEFEFAVRFCAYSELRSQAPRFDVVAIELDAEPHNALRLLKSLHERLPLLTLFAVSADASVSMIRAAIESGASDFLSLPLNVQELHKALIKSTQASAAAKTAASGMVGEIISVYGVRGGLGTTTVAVNLAVRIAALAGVQVGLVDLDLQRGDVTTFLNLAPTQSLAAITAAPSEVDEYFLQGTLTRHPSGVFVLAAPLQIEEAEAIGHAEVERALGVLRARFRYVIVDTARTLTDATLAALDASARILLITDLSVPGIRAARRTLEVLERIDVLLDRVELLVTDVVPGPIGLEEAARTLGKQPFFIIPRDPAAAVSAMNAGAPLNGVRGSRLTGSISELAAKLTGAGGLKPAGGHLLRRMFRRGGDKPYGTA